MKFTVFEMRGQVIGAFSASFDQFDEAKQHAAGLSPVFDDRHVQASVSTSGGYVLYYAGKGFAYIEVDGGKFIGSATEPTILLVSGLRNKA